MVWSRRWVGLAEVSSEGMFGIFSIFGRSREIQQFDDELRAAGLHLVLVVPPIYLIGRRNLGILRR
ncbi:MAG: hypothetical protein O3A21_08285, partial [Proteobacteria bacterium]|nr:hypothetical protein [Pseudomonadota bacterium]